VLLDPDDQGSSAPSLRVLWTVRSYSWGQLQGPQGGDDGQGVTKLHRVWTNQEVPKAYSFSQPADPVSLGTARSSVLFLLFTSFLLLCTLSAVGSGDAVLVPDTSS
jgi:hypothetical protein